MLKRWPGNPLLAPHDVKPSRAGWQIDGVFNAGVTLWGDETILLVRIAESVANAPDGEVHIPVLEQADDGWHCTTQAFRTDDPDYDFSDPRIIRSRLDPRVVHLTSMSHLRIARSADGIHFVTEDTPFLFPENASERFGCEDARLTIIDGRCFINYTAVSDRGIATALAVTDDFVRVERLGIIHAPDNRDVCLFPRRIAGSYWCLHRPAPLHFGAPEIWIAQSPDLLHWGAHRHLAGCVGTEWESHKIGGGAQMLETDRGWLQIYHGVDADQRYSLGAMLLDLDAPHIVLARLSSPLAQPSEHYERHGFFDNVLFSCGAVISGDTLRVYYGAADQVMALGTITLEELWRAMDA